ncbi:MAG TPA: right-handed parallel beta-helix repeat-containing protein [Acidimicrobiales bacterium]|nr:right-handed parallel beta-helix repeat-containing protein [Acidimicrobiales bacterium]
MRRIAGGMAAVLVATVLATVAGSSPAGAVHVSCGQTITQSTTLDSNVGPCPNNGIIIGADNITLNLNGFRVFGTTATGDGAGVLLVNRTGVTVTSGSVTDFDGGVAIAGGGGNTVVRVVAHNNIGASLGHPPAPSTAWGDGIAIQGSNDNRILFNDVQNNGPYSGIGLFTGDTDHPFIPPALVNGNLVQGNNVQNNTACRLDGLCDNDGIRLEPRVGSNCLTGTTACPGRGNRVIGNTVERNGLDGIAIFAFTTSNLVQGNTTNFNGVRGSVPGDGVRVFGYGNTFYGNTARGNTGAGVSVGRRPPSTLAFPATNPNGRNNTLTRNVAGRNGILDLHDSNPNCDNNVWSGNQGGSASPPCTLNP